MGVADSDDVLDQLVAARLVETQKSPDGSDRFLLHDLVRLFATEGLACDLPDDEIRGAQSRLVRSWLSLLCAAHTREFEICLHGEAAHWTLDLEVTEQLTTNAIAWFHQEQRNLVAAIQLAAQVAEVEARWDLAITISDFFESQGDFDSWRRTNAIGLRAACQSGNRRGEAAMLYATGGSLPANNG